MPKVESLVDSLDSKIHCDPGAFLAGLPERPGRRQRLTLHEL
jgi:hypothetical protein